MAAPIRIGILLTDSDKNDLTALKYIVLSQNVLQQSIEYQFLPIPKKNNFIKIFGSQTPIDGDGVMKEMPYFIEHYEKWLNETSIDYHVKTEILDSIVIMSSATFSDNTYLRAGEKWTVIALGNWKRYMAPPSVVEFMLKLLVDSAVYAAFAHSFPGRHKWTKGCAFDFTAQLSEARYAVLTGFLCSECSENISKNRSEQFLNDVKLLLSKSWIGSPGEPSEISITTRKLGHDLFYTKGVTPTFIERVRVKFEEVMLITIFQIIGAVAIAALLLWLGLKSA